MGSLSKRGLRRQQLAAVESMQCGGSEFVKSLDNLSLFDKDPKYIVKDGDKLRRIAPSVVEIKTGEVREGLGSPAPSPSRSGVFSVADVRPIAPPSSNTGAQTPEQGKPGLRVLIDWLACTFRVSHDESVETLTETAQGLFSPHCDSTGWVDSKRGGYGYQFCKRRGDIAIYWGGVVNPDTVHVQVTGKGCRQLEEEVITRYDAEACELLGLPPNTSAWIVFFRELLGLGVTFSRLDVAIDDFQKRISLDTVLESVHRGDCSTRFSTFREETSRGFDGELTGRTLYFGTRQSLMFVRMYDKGLERYAAGEADTVADWVRVEMETKNERALAMVRQIVSGGFSSAVAVLWSYIDFKDPDDNTEDQNHKYRRKTVAWWSDFLDVASKTRLSVDPVTRSVEKIMGWLWRQVAPSLHVVANATRGGRAFVDALIDAGGQRLREGHIALLVRDASGKDGRQFEGYCSNFS